MQIFSRLYAWVLRLSRHRRAPAWLVTLAVAESSFFPVPVDVMLAPMVLARPERAWWFALLATLGSVAGGVVGWAIGLWLIDAVLPLLDSLGYAHAYQTAGQWFSEYGFWAVFAAGFTPIPFKVFTIAAGAAGMGLPIFVAASLVGRAGRFFLVAGLVRWGGPAIEPQLQKYADRIGWGTLIICGVAFVIWRLSHS